MSFARGTFSIATKTGVQEQTGWRTDDLGLHSSRSGWWNITHLNSGLVAMTFAAKTEGAALEVADKVAALDGWDFVGIEKGWQNRNPELPRQVEAIYRSIGQPRTLGDSSPASAEQRAAAEAIQDKRGN